jgi:hypothetical protein
MKLVLGAVFLFLFLLGGVAVLLDQPEPFAIVFILLGTLVSLKVTLSGWRSYSSSIGSYEDRKKKAQLKAERFKAKMDLKVEDLKASGEALEAQYKEDQAEWEANEAKKKAQRKKQLKETKSQRQSWKEARQEVESQRIQFELDLADCEKFSIKVGFKEKITMSLKDETLSALRNEREKLEDKKRQKAQQAEIAREAKAAAKAAKIAEKEAKRQKLIGQFKTVVDSDVIAKFQKKSICLGMPQEMVDFTFGPKYESKKSVSANKEKLRCKYGRGSQNQRGNYTYKLEVAYENGFVKSFKEL